MGKVFFFILSLSVALPLIAGIFRFEKIPTTYYPILLVTIAGLLNEVVSFSFFSKTGNARPTNIYLIIEALLIIWQFYQWHTVLTKKKEVILLCCFISLVWILDYILMGNFNKFSLLFQVVSSVTLIFLAVNQINWIIINDRSSILHNPVFIICSAIILFFSYKIMAEVFYYYAPKLTIKQNIFVYEAYLNVVFNTLLLIAVLCIPPKKIFIKQ